ncbi:MAG: 4Fe-4S binding protein [Pseudomonadota bacterium]|nr:4Fe-4S binding protein [Pseudomonadota bacterium]
MNKEDIRGYALNLGADAVGFATIGDYRSKKSPDPKLILPTVKSMVVMAYRELDGSLDSLNARTAMSGRMALMELSQKNVYLLGRHIEDKCRVKAAPVLMSYPLDMGPGILGLIGDVSLRHAAVAAGLGVLGRHNLVIHPRFGSRVIFNALLTELDLPSDPPVTDELCNDCGLCVENCPAQALEVEGQTDALKCLRFSQPWGIGGAIAFIVRFTKATPEEQKKLLADPRFLQLYQASFIGFQYNCFNCLAGCPAGERR